MAKQVFSVSRGHHFSFDPDELVIVGRDTNSGPEDPLYSPRCQNKFEENIVLEMMDPDVGVLQPIVVTKREDRPVVVAGRQRVINAREAKRRQLEAGVPSDRVIRVPGMNRNLALSKVHVIEDTHRVAEGPLSLAQRCQQHLNMGYTIEEAAVTFNRSETSINNYLSLLGLLPEIQRLIASGDVPATKGYELARKGSKAQKAFLHRREHGNRSGEHKTRAPAKKVLTKIVQTRGELSRDFLLGIRFALGLVEPSEVKGLEEVIKAKTSPVVEEEPAPPPSTVKSTEAPPMDDTGVRIEMRTVTVDGKPQQFPVKVCPPSEVPDEGPTVALSTR